MISGPGLLHSEPDGALSLRDRRAASAKLRAQRLRIATAANDAFLRGHPEWLARFPDTAVARGLEDAGHHLDFLAGALDTGEPAAFVSYVAWLIDVLGARGIAPSFVAESIGFVGTEALEMLGGSAREMLLSIVDAGTARATMPPLVLRLAPGGDESPLDAAATTFLHALLIGERQAALGIAREALRVAKHPTDVYVEVFQRSLEEIGRRWQLNRITVAQEHMATAIVQFVLAQLYSSLVRTGPSRGIALVTGVEGELHQVGANLVADALEMDGWNVRFLGTNMPHDGIMEAAKEMKAELVAVSAMMLFNVDPVARLVESVRGMRHGALSPRILVGGGAFRSTPDLWREVGAHGFAVDVRGACAAARASA